MRSLVAFSAPLAAQPRLLSQHYFEQPGQRWLVHRCAINANKRQFEPMPPPADYHLGRDQATGITSKHTDS